MLQNQKSMCYKIVQQLIFCKKGVTELSCPRYTLDSSSNMHRKLHHHHCQCHPYVYYLITPWKRCGWSVDHLYREVDEENPSDPNWDEYCAEQSHLWKKQNLRSSEMNENSSNWSQNMNWSSMEGGKGLTLAGLGPHNLVFRDCTCTLKWIGQKTNVQLC